MLKRHALANTLDLVAQLQFLGCHAVDRTECPLAFGAAGGGLIVNLAIRLRLDLGGALELACVVSSRDNNSVVVRLREAEEVVEEKADATRKAQAVAVTGGAGEAEGALAVWDGGGSRGCH